jgi:hypothetical protein
MVYKIKMLCKICHKNKTDSTSGICWECCSIIERYLVLKWKENNNEEKCCHFPLAGHCWHCEKCKGTPQHLYTCPLFKE